MPSVDVQDLHQAIADYRREQRMLWALGKRPTLQREAAVARKKDAMKRFLEWQGDQQEKASA